MQRLFWSWTRKIRAILEAADPLYKYRRSYTEAQIAANRAKELKLSWGILAKNERKEVGEAMFAAAENGDAAELLNDCCDGDGLYRFVLATTEIHISPLPLWVRTATKGFHMRYYSYRSSGVGGVI